MSIHLVPRFNIVKEKKVSQSLALQSRLCYCASQFLSIIPTLIIYMVSFFTICLQLFNGVLIVLMSSFLTTVYLIIYNQFIIIIL